MHKKLISIIIPVYNTPKEHLEEALDSVATQTLKKEDMEIVLVDDASNEEKTVDYVNFLGKQDNYKGVDLKVIRHAKNMWSAEARNTGVKNSSGKYIVYLDSDDSFKKDYLKKSVLLLEACKSASWVYPSLVVVGDFNETIYLPDFDPYKIFFNSYQVNSAVFRKDDIIKFPDRQILVYKDYKFYEDWDRFMRLCAAGKFGLPMRDSGYYYRINFGGNFSRPTRIRILSGYLNVRANAMLFFKIFKSKVNYKKFLKNNYQNKHGIFSIFERMSGYFMSKLCRGKYFYKYFPVGIFLQSIFSPKKFISYFVESEKMMTQAEARCGFWEKPRFSAEDTRNTLIDNKKIVFAHWQWLIGGAEFALLNYVFAAKKSNFKVIDVASLSGTDGNGINHGEIKKDFFNYSEEQYSLDKIAPAPFAKIKFCWDLVLYDKPKILFIYGNEFFYSIVPYIKKSNPEIKIVDILHGEDMWDDGWMGVSEEYKKYIDKTIVVSELLRGTVIKKYRLDENKVVFLKNYIDLKRFDRSKFFPEKIKKNYKIPKNKIIISFIGRISYEKGPDIFIKVAELLKDDDEFEFIMAGDGPKKLDILKKAGNLRNFKYLGETKIPEKFLAITDVLICPSRYESFSLISHEAAAMNVPIIAPNIPSFIKQVTEGKFGFLYNFNDEFLEEQIRDIILENKENFRSVGSNGRSYIEKNYDFREGIKEYQKFFKELVSRDSF